MSNIQPISGFLQAWRRRRHLSQREAALCLHIPPATLKNWEQRRTTPVALIQRVLREKCK